MKYQLLLLTWLLAAGSVAAQVSPAAARPDSSVATRAVPVVAEATSAAPDTVAAIHRLFANRRKRRNIIAGVIVIGAAGAAIASTAGTDHFFNQNYYTGVYGVMAAVGVGIDLLAGVAFSRGEERRAVAAFQEHRLPKYLKRKLKRKYFVTEPAQ